MNDHGTNKKRRKSTEWDKKVKKNDHCFFCYLYIIRNSFCNHYLFHLFLQMKPIKLLRKGKDSTVSCSQETLAIEIQKRKDKEPITDWMKYLRGWSVAKEERYTGLHQRWPDTVLSVWYCKNHLTWFFLCKKVTDCKHVSLRNSSESGHEHLLVGVCFRGSAVWDNCIQLISPFLPDGPLPNIKLHYWQLCTTSGHSEVTYRCCNRPAQCQARGQLHTDVLRPLIATSGCAAARPCTPHLHPATQSNLQEDNLQPKACVPVMQQKVWWCAGERVVLQD